MSQISKCPVRCFSQSQRDKYQNEKQDKSVCGRDMILEMIPSFSVEEDMQV